MHSELYQQQKEKRKKKVTCNWVCLRCNLKSKYKQHTQKKQCCLEAVSLEGILTEVKDQEYESLNIQYNIFQFRHT